MTKKRREKKYARTKNRMKENDKKYDAKEYATFQNSDNTKK